MDSATRPPRRSSVSDAQRHEVLTRYHASGLTQRAFCEQVGVPLSTLQWWLVKARRAARPRRPAITFAEVPPPLMASPSWAVEITTPAGWVVRFREVPAPAALRAWLSDKPC